MPPDQTLLWPKEEKTTMAAGEVNATSASEAVYLGLAVLEGPALKRTDLAVQPELALEESFNVPIDSGCGERPCNQATEGSRCWINFGRLSTKKNTR